MSRPKKSQRSKRKQARRAAEVRRIIEQGVDAKPASFLKGLEPYLVSIDEYKDISLKQLRRIERQRDFGTRTKNR